MVRLTAEASPTCMHIIKDLQKLKVPHNADAIINAFQNPETAEDAAAWAEQWIHEDTLLSKEEYDHLQTLQTSGASTATQALNANLPGSVVKDEDLKAATESLENDMKAMKKQTAILDSQLKSIGLLQEETKQKTETWSRKSEKKRKRREIESRQVALAADELASDLRRLCPSDAAIKTQRSQQRKDIEAFVDHLMEEDDKDLVQLQKELHVSRNFNEAAISDVEVRCDKLVNRLTFYRREAIQHGLDRMFVESILETSTSDPKRSKKPSEDIEEVTDKDLQALEFELDSLQGEIGEVALMSASQEHMGPIHRELGKIKATHQEIEYKRLDQVLTDLTYLADKATMALDRMETHDEHFEALQTLYSAINKELPHSNPPQIPAPVSPTMPRSPTRRRPSRTLSRTNSSSATDVDPEQALLRSLGVFMPNTSAINTDMADSRPLAAAARDRIAKTITALRALEDTVETGLREHLGDTRKAWTEVWQAVGKDWESGQQIRLINESLEKSVDGLEKGVENVSSRMAKLDLKTLEEKDKAKETFVERWAR